MSLIEMVLNKMSIVEIEDMASKGAVFNINDGMITGVGKADIPTQPTKAQ